MNTRSSLNGEGRGVDLRYSVRAHGLFHLLSGIFRPLSVVFRLVSVILLVCIKLGKLVYIKLDCIYFYIILIMFNTRI